MSKETISSIRDHLLELTFKLVESFQEREALVSQIAEKKEGTQELWMFSPKRELEVFSELKKNYPELSLDTLLLLSFLIETQAHGASKGEYPLWSQSVHLLHVAGEITERINPLLLKVFYPERCKSLRLASSFEYLKEV